jgi:hypothetical protein
MNPQTMCNFCWFFWPLVKSVKLAQVFLHLDMVAWVTEFVADLEANKKYSHSLGVRI